MCSLWVFFPPSQLCCPLRFQNSPQTHRCEGFLVFGNISSFMTPSPGWVSVPNSSVSLFIFYILSYFPSKRMGCLSRYLVSSASIQKLFCGICSAFKWYFDEFVEEKVVSLFYSSAILGLPSTPPWRFWCWESGNTYCYFSLLLLFSLNISAFFYLCKSLTDIFSHMFLIISSFFFLSYVLNLVNSQH